MLHIPLSHTNNFQERYPSGFIFIDNIFYNDLRHKKAIDYSEVIIKWANERDIGPFSTAVMDQVSYKTIFTTSQNSSFCVPKIRLCYNIVLKIKRMIVLSHINTSAQLDGIGNFTYMQRC